MVLSHKLSSPYGAQMYKKHKFSSPVVYRTTWRPKKSCYLTTAYAKCSLNIWRKFRTSILKCLNYLIRLWESLNTVKTAFTLTKYNTSISSYKSSICYLHAVHPGIRNTETNCLLYSQIVSRGSPELLEMQLNSWVTHSFRGPALSGFLNKKSPSCILNLFLTINILEQVSYYVMFTSLKKV